MRERLDELDDSIRDRLDSLKDKYGEDVVQGLTEAYLTPEEAEGLETDEEKMQALVDKYLDENGNLKPEYKDLDPEVLALLKEWHERAELKPKVEKAEKAAAENGGVLPDKDGRELEASVRGKEVGAIYGAAQDSISTAMQERVTDVTTDDVSVIRSGSDATF